MNKEQARDIIKTTFESAFDRNKFIYFIKNLLNRIEEDPFNLHGQYIRDAYKQHIRKYERVGTYSDGKNRIDILIVTLQKEKSIERARTAQRNFIAGYLQGKYGRKSIKDAALVAYVSPEEEDWRFSLVRMDYTFKQLPSGSVSVSEEFTPARRWSFLVGVNEKSHTAQSRLVTILANDEHAPSLEELENAFDIETVTKEFFLKYRDLFIRTKEELDRIVKKDLKIKENFEANGVDTVNFAKKLLGQIVFLYFLQKKGWFGVGRDEDWGTGSKHFLRELFEKKRCQYNNFFNDVLEPLFYEALRIDRSSSDDYYSRFDCKIPFLNGGLFDPIGNYDWVHTDINLPNTLFSNTRKTREGDIGDGILDIFDRYNFTVKEDEPLEKEVAIDPELLGKTYEKFNAIRPDNFDEFKKALKSGKSGEETKFNKKFGVYYTPREIVHYMCQQSLVNYLYTELNKEAPYHGKDGTQIFAFGNEQLNLTVEDRTIPKIGRKDIETLIYSGEQVRQNEARVINEGRETRTYSHKMPEAIRNNAALIDQKLAEITVCDPAVGSGAFPVGMMNEIVRIRKVLSTFIQEGPRTKYNFKRHCIEHTLYGVDIDPGAVEIAKLRLWLSLIVDEDDMDDIKPLPNLDYKIVCGDSLLGYPYTPRGLDKVEEFKRQFFDEVDPNKKRNLRNRIDEAIFGLFKNTEGNLGYKITIDYKINFSEVFSQNGGFDVVIANPPYIQLQKLRGNPLQNAYKSQNFEVHNANGDIYCLFYEKGMDILKKCGHLVFITSNKWMRAAYGEKLRRFFLEYNPLQLIDLGPGIFDSATVDTNILIIQKNKNKNSLQAATLSREDDSNLNILSALQTNGVTLKDLSQDTWFIGSNAELKLREKIERMGKPLKEWDVKMYRGVLTGLNEAFIIDTATRDRLVAEDPKSAEILKPILRGRDIKRYSYEWAGLWLIATFPSLHLDIEEYPAVKNYLLNNFDIRQLEQSGKKYPKLNINARKLTNNKWFETQDTIAYYSEFEKEKVVWIELVDEGRFSCVESGIYTEATTFLMTHSRSKYLAGCLNSSLINWYFDTICASSGTGTNRWKKIYVELLPVLPIIPQNSSVIDKIEELTDEILTAKKQIISVDTQELEKQIDQLVYKLYDLTPEEIAIVEGSSSL